MKYGEFIFSRSVPLLDRKMNKSERRDMSDLTDFCDRIRTVADEAFGPFPRMTAVEALDEIEKGIHEYKRAVAVALAVLEVIADPKAELPVDGRETCRIYEDMKIVSRCAASGAERRSNWAPPSKRQRKWRYERYTNISTLRACLGKI